MTGPIAGASSTAYAYAATLLSIAIPASKRQRRVLTRSISIVVLSSLAAVLRFPAWAAASEADESSDVAA